MNIQEYIEERTANTTSKNTIFLVRSSLTHFEKFLNEVTVEDKINEIRQAQRANPMDLLPYDTLADFVDYLKRKKLSPRSVMMYTTQVKDFLKTNRILIFNENFRQFVKFPKPPPADYHAITKQEIKKLLKNSNDKWQALIHVGATSGIRLGTILSLTPSMINVRPNCVRVTMPPEITKTKRKTEVAFMTLHAHKLMDKFKKTKLGKVLEVPYFTTLDTHINQKSAAAEWEFGQIRSRADLETKYPNSDRFLIRFHSLRSWFFTKAVEKLGVDMAQHLTGHKIYLEQYLRHDPKFLEREYNKLAPTLDAELGVKVSPQ